MPRMTRQFNNKARLRLRLGSMLSDYSVTAQFEASN